MRWWCVGLRLEPREAPLTSLDPTADDTDVYAFTANDAPDALTVVANWIPFEDPAGGPNFYRFDDRARLLHQRRQHRRRQVRRPLPVQVQDDGPEPELVPVRAARRQLDQRPEAERQSRRYDGHARDVPATASCAPAQASIARNLPVAPNNVGPKTIPNYDAVADAGDPAAARRRQGVRRPASTIRSSSTSARRSTRSTSASGTGNAGGGKDDLAGYNVHSIVLQVPEAAGDAGRQGRRGARAPPNAVVGVWSLDRARRRVQVIGQHDDRQTGHGARLGPGLPPGQPAGQRGRHPAREEGLVQPHAARPTTRKNYGKYVVKPELAKVMNVLFPGLNVPETDRTDIVQALLTGIPGLTADRARTRRRPTR